MSISNSLANALSGMAAASRMAEIVSSNIANSMTEGYGRRRLELSAASVGGQGAGVEIGQVIRVVDRGVIGDRRLADAALARSETLVGYGMDLERLMGTVGGEGGLDAAFSRLSQSMMQAAGDPSSSLRLEDLRSSLSGAISGLNSASSDVQKLRTEADAKIKAQVDDLNTALKQVERLNADITRSLNTGQDPSGLLDQRQQVIDRIAAIVPVRELDRDGGQVALMTPAGETLIDGTARQFGFTPNAVVTEDMTLQSGALSGLTIDGQPIAADGVGKLKGGSLGALFQTRDVDLVEAQRGLDRIAADLVLRFQDPAVDPTLLPGDAGLITDGGAAFDPANTDGLAGRLALNAAVDPEQGGALWRLRDGINAAAPGPAGDSTLLLRLGGALDGAGPVTQLSMTDAIGALQAETASARLRSEQDVGFATARWESLKAAEAANGVDTDYEMQMLLRIEQAYTANARLIQTIDSMLDRLMEL